MAEEKSTEQQSTAQPDNKLGAEDKKKTAAVGDGTSKSESDTATTEKSSERSPATSPTRSQGATGEHGTDRGPRMDRGPRDRPRTGRPGGRRFFKRKKVNFFSVNKIDDISYKDAQTLKQFIGDRGKILPRRHTGLSAMHQRKLKAAIKRARNIALLPFAGDRDSVTSPKVEEVK